VYLYGFTVAHPAKLVEILLSYHEGEASNILRRVDIHLLYYMASHLLRLKTKHLYSLCYLLRNLFQVHRYY